MKQRHVPLPSPFLRTATALAMSAILVLAPAAARAQAVETEIVEVFEASNGYLVRFALEIEGAQRLEIEAPSGEMLSVRLVAAADQSSLLVVADDQLSMFHDGLEANGARPTLTVDYLGQHAQSPLPAGDQESAGGGAEAFDLMLSAVGDLHAESFYADAFAAVAEAQYDGRSNWFWCAVAVASYLASWGGVLFACGPAVITVGPCLLALVAHNLAVVSMVGTCSQL